MSKEGYICYSDDHNYNLKELLSKNDSSDFDVEINRKPTSITTLNTKQANNENLDAMDTRSDKDCLQRYFGAIKGGSLRGSVFAFASISFGSGLLSFPIAIAKTGPVVGLILFILVTLLSYWTLDIFMMAGRKLKKLDFSELVLHTMGNKMRIVADISNITLCLGVIMSYQYIVSVFSFELLKDLFDYDPGTTNSWPKFIQMFGCMVLFQVPLSLLKNVSKLQYASILGSFTLIYTIIVVCIEMPFYLQNYFKDPKHEVSNIWFVKLDWNVLDSVAIFYYGYCAHNGIFQVYQDLSRPSRRRMKKVLNGAVIMEVIMYFFMAMGGFLSEFYDCQDVFIRRPDLPGFNDYFMKVAKILIIVCLHCTMAINYNIMRDSINFMFNDNKPMRTLIDATVTIFIYIASNTLTFFVTNVSQILNFIGGISTVVISTFLPIMIHVLTSDQKMSHYTNITKLVICFIFSGLGIAATVKGIFDFFK